MLLVLLSGRIVKPFSENYEKQKRFITDAGHELKTPLTIISADAEVLTMDFGENEWINDIQSQTKRLAELTNDLILLARMEEQTGSAQKCMFPLSVVAEETCKASKRWRRHRGKRSMRTLKRGFRCVGKRKPFGNCCRYCWIMPSNTRSTGKYCLYGKAAKKPDSHYGQQSNAADYTRTNEAFF